MMGRHGGRKYSMGWNHSHSSGDRIVSTYDPGGLGGTENLSQLSLRSDARQRTNPSPRRRSSLPQGDRPDLAPKPRSTRRTDHVR